MLTQAGVDFSVIPSSAEEIHDLEMPLHLLCEENARRKAVAVAQDHPYATVIGADTLVYIDQKPLGKPKTEQEARDMLLQLSGRKHQVCTGVCLVKGADRECFHVITEVEFNVLTGILIADYMSKVNVMDKAGSYAVQEHGEMIVKEVRGDYNNVVGLPLDALLKRLGQI